MTIQASINKRNKSPQITRARAFGLLIIAAAIAVISLLFAPAKSPAEAVVGDTINLTFVTNTSNAAVTLPLTGSYTGISIIWGDGTTNTSLSHSYATAGIYNVRVTAPTSGTVSFGTIAGWTGAQYLTAVTYWNGISSLEGAFSHATNLVDVPNYLPTTVTNAHYMFWQASNFNDPDVSLWDVSRITNFGRMFADASVFNQPLNSWNTSSATDMGSMFVRAVAFNQDLNHWDTSHVTTMQYMFQDAYAFNGDVSTWDTSNVTLMDGMFGTASDPARTVFNRDIGAWNTSRVTSMNSMFVRNSQFNQNLNNWDVSHVTDMRYMFQNAVSFNGNISNWQTHSLTLMTAMFFSATSFNQNIGAWDVSHVTDMMYTFMKASSFNQNLNSWNTQNVQNMSRTFEAATAFNGQVSNWNTSSATTMFRMFADTPVFNQPIGNWNVSNVTDLSLMFIRSPSFNQDITNWNTSSATTMRKMFQGATAFDQPIGSWNTSRVTNMSEMFEDATSFNQPVNTWNMSRVNDISYMFYGATSFNQPVNTWNTSAVTAFTEVFTGATNFNQSIAGWSLAAAGPTHIASYDLAGGTGTAPMPAVLLNTESFTVSGNSTFARAGYTFTGWLAGATSYQSGDTYPATSANVTLVAQWSANQLIVTVDPGNQTSTTTFTTRTAQVITSAPATPRLEGFRFLGWYTEAIGGSAIAFPYAHPFTSNFTIYGHWQYIPVSRISFAANGSSGELPSPLTLPVGSRLSLTDSMGLSKTGFDFDGWTDGTKSYAKGTEIIVPATDMTLSPIWKEIPNLPGPIVTPTPEPSPVPSPKPLPKLPVDTLTVKLAKGSAKPTLAAAASLQIVDQALSTYPALADLKVSFTYFVHSKSATKLTANSRSTMDKALSRLIDSTTSLSRIETQIRRIVQIPLTSNQQYDFVRITLSTK